QVADDHVVRVDADGGPADADAVPGRGLAGDGDVRGADADAVLQVDGAGHAEHDDPRADGVARLPEGAGAGVRQARHDVDLAAAAAEAVHAAAPGPGEGWDVRLRQVRRLRGPGDVRLALLRPAGELGLGLLPRLVLGFLVGGAALVLGALDVLRHLRVL